MRVTWLVPDVYGFITDELHELSARDISIRVLSGQSITPSIRRQLPGIEFHFCASESWLPTSSRQRAMFNRLRKIHGWRRMLSSRWDLSQINGFLTVMDSLQWGKDDIIHSHFAHPSGLGGALQGEVPHVMTLRGYDILTTRDYGALWNPFFRSNLTSDLHRDATITVATKFAMVRALQMFSANQELVLLANGMNQSAFEARGTKTKKALELPNDATLFLVVGNLVPVKNHLFLLRTFTSWLHKTHSNGFLLFCGGGELKQTLKAEAERAGIQASVRFLGRLGRQELTDMYGLADALLHPSMSEGFCNVIVESLILGLPVVSSPVGIAPELIVEGELGLLPDISDASQWESAMDFVAQNHETLKQNVARKHGELASRFSMEKRVDAFLGMYQKKLER